MTDLAHLPKSPAPRRRSKAAPIVDLDVATVLRRFEHMELAQVDVLPARLSDNDREMIVLALRPVGRRARRYVAVTAGLYGVQAFEIFEGCRILTQIAAAKAATEGVTS